MAIKGAFFDAATGKWKSRETGIDSALPGPQEFNSYTPGSFSGVTGANGQPQQGGLMGQANQLQSDILTKGEYGISADDQKANSDLALGRTEQRLKPQYRALTADAAARGVYYGGPMTSAYGTVQENFADTVKGVETQIAIDNRARMASERSQAIQGAVSSANTQEQLGLSGERLNLDAIQGANSAVIEKAHYDELAKQNKFKNISEMAKGAYQLLKEMFGGDEPSQAIKDIFSAISDIGGAIKDIGKDVLGGFTNVAGDLVDIKNKPSAPLIAEGAFTNMIAPNAFSNMNTGAFKDAVNLTNAKVGTVGDNSKIGVAEEGAVTGIEQGGVTGISQGGVTGIGQGGVTGIGQGGVTGIASGGVTGIEKDAFGNVIGIEKGAIGDVASGNVGVEKGAVGDVGTIGANTTIGSVGANAKVGSVGDNAKIATVGDNASVGTVKDSKVGVAEEGAIVGGKGGEGGQGGAGGGGGAGGTASASGGGGITGAPPAPGTPGVPGAPGTPGQSPPIVIQPGKGSTTDTGTTKGPGDTLPIGNQPPFDVNDYIYNPQGKETYDILLKALKGLNKNGETRGEVRVDQSNDGTITINGLKEAVEGGHITREEAAAVVKNLGGDPKVTENFKAAGTGPPLIEPRPPAQLDPITGAEGTPRGEGIPVIFPDTDKPPFGRTTTGISEIDNLPIMYTKIVGTDQEDWTGQQRIRQWAERMWRSSNNPSLQRFGDLLKKGNMHLEYNENTKTFGIRGYNDALQNGSITPDEASFIREYYSRTGYKGEPPREIKLSYSDGSTFGKNEVASTEVWSDAGFNFSPAQATVANRARELAGMSHEEFSAYLASNNDALKYLLSEEGLDDEQPAFRGLLSDEEMLALNQTKGDYPNYLKEVPTGISAAWATLKQKIDNGIDVFASGDAEKVMKEFGPQILLASFFVEATGNNVWAKDQSRLGQMANQFLHMGLASGVPVAQIMAATVMVLPAVGKKISDVAGKLNLGKIADLFGWGGGHSTTVATYRVDPSKWNPKVLEELKTYGLSLFKPFFPNRSDGELLEMLERGELALPERDIKMFADSFRIPVSKVVNGSEYLANGLNPGYDPRYGNEPPNKPTVPTAVKPATPTGAKTVDDVKQIKDAGGVPNVVGLSGVVVRRVMERNNIPLNQVPDINTIINLADKDGGLEVFMTA